MPISWTIGGSDSGAGAGIQADIKTMNSLGVYAASVLSSITAQNTKAVLAVEAVADDLLQKQLQALAEDLPALALKTGMLGSVSAVRSVAAQIAALDSFYVCDPVLISTSGQQLCSASVLDAVKTLLIPQADLITPNLSEALSLLGIDKKSAGFYAQNDSFALSGCDKFMEEWAEDLLRLGARAVLLKGGHLDGQFSQDYFTDGTTRFWLSSPRILTRSTHGTGCTLSAAITAAKAVGMSTSDALVLAKAYLNQCLEDAPGLGTLHGPLAHHPWREQCDHIPWMTYTARDGRQRGCFARENDLGFYPIVGTYEQMEKLIDSGAKLIQLRIKNPGRADLEEELRKAVSLAKSRNCRLYINDHWQLALKYSAYGVHLGQDDLKNADLRLIENAGVNLGVSTHCLSEVSRALAVRPSYIAVGPIHATTTKKMDFNPQGVEGLRRWRKMLDYPLVAIGGIFLDNAAEIIEAGAGGIAVVRDIANCADLSERVKQWNRLFNVKAETALSSVHDRKRPS